MDYIKYTDFKDHSKTYFDKIEDGNSYIIIRKGKPVAKIIPFNKPEGLYKREIQKVTIKGNKKATDYLLEERNEV